MDLNQLLEKQAPDVELAFEPCHVELASGKEMFAYVCHLDGYFLIKDPLLIYYLDIDQSVLKRYNHFTDDKILLLQPHSVAIVSPLNSEYYGYYKKASEGSNEVDSGESSDAVTLH